MAQNLFSIWHIALMETALPVGIAIVNRAKKENVGKILDGLMSADTSIGILKEEGREDAQLVRMQLDRVIPGLGNPVIEVEVSVKPKANNSKATFSDPELVIILNRIESRMNELKIYLDD